MKTILVTGATGFIGKHLVPALVAAGHKVIALVRRTSDTSALAGLPDVRFYFSDENLENAFLHHPVDGVIHTATSKSDLYSEVLEANVVFPLRLLEHCRSHQVAFFINTDTFFTKQDNYQYLNHYTDSKTMFSNILKTFAPHFTCVNLQLEHVYGDGDRESKFVTWLLKKLSCREPSIDLTAGIQKRDFIYVKDVVECYKTVLLNIGSISGFHTFEVGTGMAISIKEFVEKLRGMLSPHTALHFGALPLRPGEFSESKANIQPLLQWGWKPQYTLDKGLNEMISIEKMQQNHIINRS